MADMKQIKAAIGENNGLAGGAPLRDAKLDTFEVENFFAGSEARAGCECGYEFMRSNRYRTRLADYDASSQIRNFDRSFDLKPTSHASGEGCDDGVARAGDIEDLTSARW